MKSIGTNDFIQFRALCNELYSFLAKEGDETIRKSLSLRLIIYISNGELSEEIICRKTIFSLFMMDEINNRVTLLSKGTKGRLHQRHTVQLI